MKTDEHIVFNSKTYFISHVNLSSHCLFPLVFFLFLKSLLFHFKNVIHYVLSVMDLVVYKNVLPLFLNVAYCSVKPYGGTLEDGKFITMSSLS